MHAGTDACATAHRRKMNRYRHILPALRRAGVIFQPLVWSAEGRPHPATVRVMESALRMVRTRKGAEAAADLRDRWRHEITIAILRRRAAMSRSVVPRRTTWEEWMLAGITEQPPTDEDRRSEPDPVDKMEEAYWLSIEVEEAHG